MNSSEMGVLDMANNNSETLSRSRIWPMCGNNMPSSMIVFFTQMIVIYIIVGVSLYNLTLGHEPHTLWISLLSSALCLIIPAPKIKTKTL